ncbi:slc49a4 [Symbiodinium sp. KB8]|nr:slc49a4 [Symbiodinium sp. KB8]
MGVLPGEEEQVRVTAWRWYALAVFSFAAFMQGLVWAVPGPISAVLAKELQCDSDCDALLVNWGPIMFIVFTFPQAWLIDHSLRSSTLLLAALVTASGWVRVASAYIDDTSTVTVLLHVAQALNASGGPIAMGAVSRLSQLWFPAHQRSFATAVAAEFNMAGVAIAFVLGPALAPEDGSGGLGALWWALAVPPSVALLVALLHFPDAPKTAPSRSARMQRDDAVLRAARGGARGAAKDRPTGACGWLSRLRALLFNFDFAVLAAGYAASAGIYSGWGPLLSINLRSVHVSESVAGWIGFSATMSGAVGGLAVGFVHSRVGSVRPMLLALLTVATAAFVVFALSCQPTAPRSTALPHPEWLLFLSATVGGFCVNAMIPLMYEASVEAVFGEADEGSVGAVLALVNNICCLAFLAVPIGSGSTAWMNWTMAGAVAVFVVVFALWKERERRKAIDLDAAGAAAVKRVDVSPLYDSIQVL